MYAIAEIAFYIILRLILWIVLFPAVWIMCTPFILIAAAFKPRPYQEAVTDMFRGVTEFWKEWGIVFPP